MKMMYVWIGKMINMPLGDFDGVLRICGFWQEGELLLSLVKDIWQKE